MICTGHRAPRRQRIRTRNIMGLLVRTRPRTATVPTSARGLAITMRTISTHVASLTPPAQSSSGRHASSKVPRRVSRNQATQKSRKEGPHRTRSSSQLRPLSSSNHSRPSSSRSHACSRTTSSSRKSTQRIVHCKNLASQRCFHSS